MQARTEIELLTLLSNNDVEDQNNIGESRVDIIIPTNLVLLHQADIFALLFYFSPALDTLYVPKSPMYSLRDAIFKSL